VVEGSAVAAAGRRTGRSRDLRPLCPTRASSASASSLRSRPASSPLSATTFQAAKSGLGGSHQEPPT
jgi:hypothetical protein